MYLMFSFVPYIECFQDITVFPKYINRIRHNLGAAPINILELLEMANSLIDASKYSICGAWSKNGARIIPMTRTDVLTLGPSIFTMPGSRACYNNQFDENDDFSRLPDDILFDMLRKMNFQDRKAALDASGHLKSMWSSNTFLDIETNEVFFECLVLPR